MMNSQELETAIRLKLNLVVLILEDHAFGMIRWKQAIDRFPDFGMTFGNPDFVEVCGGIRGARDSGQLEWGVATDVGEGVHGWRGAGDCGADRLFGKSAGTGG